MSSGADIATIKVPVTVDGVTTWNEQSYVTTDKDFRMQMEHLDDEGLLPF